MRPEICDRMEELDKPAFEAVIVDLTAEFAALRGFEIDSAVFAVALAVIGVRFFGNRFCLLVAAVARCH